MNPIAYSSPTRREGPLRGAKGVFDPDNAVFARRESLQGDHIEAHRAEAPRRLALEEKPGGTDDLALFARRHRARSSAEIGAAALPHFDDGQHGAIEAHQIELAAPAAQVAGENDAAARLQILGRKLLCRGAPLQARFSGHAPYCAGGPGLSARICGRFVAI